MISVDFINVDIPKTVGRLLPFWARGRFVQRLMVAILTPLNTVHQQFKAWVRERYIESHVTFQKESIEWYFKHRLGNRLASPTSSFRTIQGVDDDYCCFSLGNWNNELEWDNELLWNNDGDESGAADLFVPPDDGIYVIAPAIKEDPDYTEEDYERDIRRILESYRIGFTKINIITPNNQNE